MQVVTRKWIIVIISILLVTNSYADNDPYLQHQTEYIPEAPNAQAIARAIDFPVNLYTGVPDINIPLYTIEVGDISIPITLNYQGGGIRPSQEATSVGLGWNINAGGAITRTVKCADDFMEYHPNDGQYTRGYFKNKQWPDVNKAYQDLDYYHRCSRDPSSYYNFPSDYYLYADLEPDLFFYNTPSGSGKFFFKKDSSIVYHDASQNFKIIPLMGVNPRFYALDSKGTKYFFEIKESTIVNYISTSDYVNTTYGGLDYIYPIIGCTKEIMKYTSTWFLTKMISQTNDTIDFEYAEESFQLPLQEDLRIRTKLEGISIEDFPEGKQYSRSKTEIESYRLTGIRWRGGRVDFEYGLPRNDIRGICGFDESYALTDMKVRNTDDAICCHWRMSYSYFNSDITDIPFSKRHLFLRLRLDSLQNTLTENEPYRFTYNDNVQLPVKNTKNTDYYGFYNGINQQNDYYCHGGSTLQSTNKAIVENCAKMGILESIQHPTGGTTVFHWESNRIRERKYFEKSQNISNSPLPSANYSWINTNQGELRGGLRISRIDGETSKQYIYNDGKELVQPCDSFQEAHVVVHVNGPYILETILTRYHIQLSSPTRQLSTVKNGNIIGYSNVFELSANANFTEYTYYNEEETLENPWYPYCPSTINWMNGMLQSQTYYDNECDTIKTIQNSYSCFLTADNDTTGFIEISPGNYCIYTTKIECPKLTSSICTEYNSNGKICNTQRWDYNERLLCTEHSEQIGADVRKKRYKYPCDYTDELSASMVNANIISKPITEWTLRNGIVYEGAKVVYGKYSLLANNGEAFVCGGSPDVSGTTSSHGLYLPKCILSVNTEGNTNNIDDCLLDTAVIFDSYTKYGKVREMRCNGIPVTYLWAYQGMYPIAKLKNVTYQQFCMHSTISEQDIPRYTNADPEHVRDILWGVSYGLPNSSTIIDLYNPLVGVINRTDEHGIITCYTYDRAGRLKTTSLSNTNSLGTVERTFTYDYGNNFVKSTNYPTYNYRKNINSIQYYDAWGRPSVTASQGFASDGTYNYGMTTYDVLGRKEKEYVPIPSGSLSGSLIDSITFVNTSASQLSNDMFGYVKTEYDAMGRESKTTMPGQIWHSNDKSTTYQYRVNDNNEVKRYGVSGNTLCNEGYYPKSVLTCVETVTPDGITVKSYKDMFGNVILERKSDNIDTYYVYDDLNRLRFVLPPMYQDNPDLGAYAYQYEYDGKGRVRKKVLPGCAPMLYWYDQRDNVIKMQDGVLAETGRFRVWDYDGLDRQLSQAVVDSEGNKEYEMKYYYDDYSFLDYYTVTLPSGINTLRPSTFWNSKRQMTGLWQKASNGESLISVYGYDEYGYPSYSSTVGIGKYLSINHLSNNLAGDVLEESFTEYKYDNTTNRMVRVLRGEIINNYDDLHTKHLTSSVISLTDQFNNTRTDTISALAYDDFGKVIYNNRGGANADMMYEYDNMHGWLTKTKSSGGFEQQLFRETDGSYPRYDGNISAMTWKTSRNLLRRFDYLYDSLNRLSRADFSYYSVNNASSSNPTLSLIPYVGMDNEDYTSEYFYDKNGNILAAYRQGLIDGNDDTYGLRYDTMDDYLAEYNGNQLKSVYGSGIGTPSYYGSSSFVDGADEDVEYAYNGNGAMTMNLNKGISNIEYDLAGNLKEITFVDNRYIRYVYAPDGTRLRTIHAQQRGNAWIKDSIDYCGNIRMKQGKLNMYQFPGGYISFNNNSLGDCHYYVQDYLGNNRMVVRNGSTTEQVTHYYPYGGVIGGIDMTPTVQPYKFEGKELDNTYGLDWYDIQARQYDPVVPSWHRMDPLCEKYYDVSPYSYCKGDPVNKYDPDGRKVWVFATSLPGSLIKDWGWKYSATHTFVVVKKTNGGMLRFEYGPKGDNFIDNISGMSQLTRCFYEDTGKSISNYFKGIDDENIKTVKEVNVPKGKSSDQFDNDIIKSAKDFEGNTEIKYRVIPTNGLEGNCNTSTTSLLKNAGVSMDEINKIGDEISGTKIGFGTTRAWTEEERKQAQEESTKLIESLSNHIGF